MSNLPELKKEQADAIENAFASKIEEREGLKNVYAEIIKKEISSELCDQAKACRLKLVKVRTGIAEIHKTQKAYFLAAGRFVDAWKNKETEPVIQMENALNEIEEHYKRIEERKIKELHDKRAAELEEYEADFIPDNLGDLEQSVFDNFLLGAKTTYEKKIAAEKKAEEERKERERIEGLHNERKESILQLWQFVPDENKIENFGQYDNDMWNELVNYLKLTKSAHEAEQKRVREENERLKKEAEEKEKKRQAEIKKIREKEKAERKEREAKEAKLKAEKAEAERKLKEAEAAEAKRKADIEAAEQAELKKGDAQKLVNLTNDLAALKTKYQFKSKKNQAKYKGVGQLLDKVINYLNQ